MAFFRISNISLFSATVLYLISYTAAQDTDVSTCAQDCIVETVNPVCLQPDYLEKVGWARCLCQDPPIGTFLQFHACLRSNCTRDETQQYLEWMDVYCDTVDSFATASLSTFTATPTATEPASVTGLSDPALILDIFPECGAGCVSPIYDRSCEEDDWRCYCSSTEIVEAFSSCLPQRCEDNAIDIVDSIRKMNQVCYEFGEPVSLSTSIGSISSFTASPTSFTSRPPTASSDLTASTGPRETVGDGQNSGDNDDDGSPTPIGAIVGGVVGGVVGLVLIAAVAFFLVFKSKRRHKSARKQIPMDVGTGVEDVQGQGVWYGKEETSQWQPPNRSGL